MLGEHGLLARGTVRRWLAVPAGVLAVVLVLAGCSSEDNAEPGGPSESVPSLHAPTTATGDPVVEAEQAALVAYRGMWDAYLAALSVPDPQHPDLGRFAAEDALRVLVGGVESAEREGLAGRGEVELDPVVEELTPADTPTSAEIVDCADTSRTELYRVDGEPYKDTPGGLRRAEAKVRDVGGMWKVIGFALYEVGSCETE